MKKGPIISVILVLFLSLTVGAGRGYARVQEAASNAAVMLGTAFTYQGQLRDGGGSPLTSTCGFDFTLWDAVTGPNQLGGVSSVTGVGVVNGYFTVRVNGGGEFGPNAFNGEARWLQIAVLCSGDVSAVTLTPRQAVMPAPYALALPGLRTVVNATSPNVIGGYLGNGTTSGTIGATIGGGGWNGHTNDVTANYGTVGGGLDNTVSGIRSVVSGGEGNVASGVWSSVGGGGGNTATGDAATVSGGGNNTAGEGASVGGGSGNAASGSGASVSGGYNNTAAGIAASVGGGETNAAGGNYASVAGGDHNTASGLHSSVGGGDGNTASGGVATIGGGHNNSATYEYTTIAGGDSNSAGAEYASVGGGMLNNASGYAATVPGGKSNTAVGEYSFAAGQQAQANHAGSFVWADSTDAAFASTAANQFLVRAGGGVGIGVNNPAGALHVKGTGLSTAVFESSVGGAASNIQYGSNGDWYIRSSLPAGMIVMQDTGGNVGIGATNPPDKLTVLGDIRVGTSGTNGCVKRYDGTAIAGSCSSDARLKKNITPFGNVLDLVTQLQPVYYNWRADEFPAYAFDGSTLSYGVIAQAVEQVLPELVGVDEHGYKTVNYSEIPLLLLQALKDLRAEKDTQITAQQEQMDAMQTRLAGLEAQVKALKQASPVLPLTTPWPWLALVLIVMSGMAMFTFRRRMA
jgi:hypothetical protein